MDEQLQLSDLVSRRLWVHGLFAATCLALIAAVFALQIWVAKALPGLAGKLTMLDAQLPGSLAQWLSSLLLLWAGILSLVVYSVRKHKVDDYRGYYRVWMWGALCWFLVATDRAASLHAGFQQIMTAVTGTRVLGDGSIWWMLPATVLLAAVGARLAVDARESRITLAALVCAAIAYIAAAATYNHWLTPRGPLAPLLVIYALPIVGDLFVAMSINLAARHVLLDAEGVLPRKKTKVATKAKAKPKLAIAQTDDEDENASSAQASEAQRTNDADDDSDDENEDGHASNSKNGTSHVLRHAAPPNSADDDSADDDADDSGDANDSAQSKLSKAERKALKRKLTEDRLKHQQKKAANW
jgi:hypothetical protein